ncbi:oxidoreductase [Zhengella mangrovi]|uniref:Oxidoreductase n=1 Tax=Zhengella mangrovi TaxID=1982044 RepID=A0A2G1QIB9_9HYPH|nr:NADH:flavin oxidoreductase/NADH oxidase [Zhengella mangrovi]PHP65266.1 oxidoreductase [Zhengella mangrovi]
MSALFSTFRLGPLDLGNRIVVSPMCQYSAENGCPQSWHLIHAGSLMMSGAGLVILEATAVEARGRITHGCLGLYTDEQETALGGIVREARKLSGARIGIQLGHAGRRGSARSIRDRWKGESLPPEEGAWRTCSASAIAYNDQWAVPEELTPGGIADLVEAYADAARRAVRAGFDLVEVHAAHGYLLHGFLSPLTNQRSDSYGGSLENRMRFPLEVVRAVRTAVDGRIALGVRVNSTDWHPDGATPDDAIVFAKALEAEGVDYVVMSAGNLVPDAVIPPASPGHQVPFATRIKQETGLAAMAVGFIVDPQQAESIVANGEADLVAIARAIIDDPRWGWHAAAALGADIDYPPQYLRARPNNWTGYRIVHPDSQPASSSTQADRPSASGWDRPDGAGRNRRAG